MTVIHATIRAVQAMFKPKRYWVYEPPLRAACTGAFMSGMALTSGMVLDMTHATEPAKPAFWPTCPMCLVILDAAQEGRAMWHGAPKE